MYVMYPLAPDITNVPIPAPATASATRTAVSTRPVPGGLLLPHARRASLNAPPPIPLVAGGGMLNVVLALSGQAILARPV